MKQLLWCAALAAMVAAPLGSALADGVLVHIDSNDPTAELVTSTVPTKPGILTPLCTAPCDLRVPPGSYAMMNVSGFGGTSRPFTIAAGDRATLHVASHSQPAFVTGFLTASLAAGTLFGGGIIWATAAGNHGLEVGGEAMVLIGAPVFVISLVVALHERTHVTVGADGQALQLPRVKRGFGLTASGVGYHW